MNPSDSSSDPKKKVTNLALKGNLSAACVTLQGTKPATDVADTLTKLQAKHPTEPPFSPPPNNQDSYTVSDGIVLSCLKSFRNGTGGGPFGLLPEHLLTACNSPTHADFIKNLTNLINLMLEGRTDKSIVPFLFGANLTALEKEGGDVRPIAIGNTLRRLAAKCISAKYAEDLKKILQPHQSAIGKAGGIETVIHTMRNFLDEHNSSDLAVLKIDIRNAFNCLYRATITHKFNQYLPKAVNYINTCYGSPSLLFYAWQNHHFLAWCAAG